MKLEIICDVKDQCKTPNYAPRSMIKLLCSDNFKECAKRDDILYRNQSKGLVEYEKEKT
jgi:hypothetical protein